MNSSKRPSPSLRRFLLVQLSVAAGLASAYAQSAPTPVVDAATLSKYDKNKNGVLDADEAAAYNADKAKAVPVEEKPASATGQEALVMSPFEVVSDTKGYYSANTMSGTRFNTKLEDLGSSVSVMTKEQMSDFAMLDINDIFLYTGNAEGTGTYTDVSVDRNGSVQDNVSLNPQGANRVRGIAPANISFGNYETMGRVPVDPINIDGVEVSRGPNASVFGLGNPSGTLNQVAATANTTRDRSYVQVRGDNYDGFRTAVDFNRVLLRNKLAIRGSAVYQKDGSVRKPSGYFTERYNGMIKYQPFKNTTINAGLSYYHAYGNRPNSLPPRDGISYWLASGKPTWDPIAQVIHVNGTTLGPFTASTYAGPDYFNNSFTGNNHNYLYIDQSGVAYWSAPSGFTSTVGPISGAQTNRFMSTSTAAGVSGGRLTNQPLFTTTPSVVDKSIYDWSDLNLSAVNRGYDRTLTTNVSIDQTIVNTPKHWIAAQAGFFREDSQRYQRNYMGIANDNGQSGQLFIDINEKLLDGTANPFFLRPYLAQDQPRTTYQPQKWDTYRAQLAYRLDFTHDEGWSKWLGTHQISGYDEYKYRINRRYSYREAILDAHPWITTVAGQSRGNQGAITGGPAAAPAITRSYLRYYVGDNSGNNIDYAPSEFKPGVYNFVWGNAATGVFNREPSLLGLAAVTDATGGGNNSKTVLKTIGGVIQSHFIEDRLVTTFGRRVDKQYQKAGQTPQLLNPDGITFDFNTIDHWAAGDYKFNSGPTTTQQYVGRPFRNWAWTRKLDDGSTMGHYLTSFLNGLSFTYNRSDSFTPQDPKINLFQQALPNPSGKGKDYGIALNMFDNKFVLRINRYENIQLNKSGGDAGTIAQRVTRIDVASTAQFLLAVQAGNWVRATNPSFTPDQVQAEVAKQIGIPTDLQNALVQEFNAGTISSTQDITGKGTEVEIAFNPTSYWTVTANGSDTKSINSNVSTDINNWIAQRMPIWTTIVDQAAALTWTPAQLAAEPAHLWWTHNYGGSQTAQQNFAAFITTPFSVTKQLEGKASPQIRRYKASVSSNYQLAGMFSDNNILKRISVGGAIRWEDKAAIGYYGKQSLPAVITDLDASKPIYDKARYYVDLRASYRTKLWADKVGATFQFNVRNVGENGRLQAVGAFPDGTPNSYRIIDPAQYILTASFDL